MPQAEVWKSIFGYEGIYSVSNLGRVRRDETGYIQKSSVNCYGYCQVGLSAGKGKTFRLHKLVAQAFLPAKPNCHQINHKDTNKQNNAVSNLEYVTGFGNIEHAKIHDLFVKGERHHNAKLTDEDVIKIRALYAAGGISQRKLAVKFGVAQKIICLVVNNRLWVHVQAGAHV